MRVRPQNLPELTENALKLQRVLNGELLPANEVLTLSRADVASFELHEYYRVNISSCLVADAVMRALKRGTIVGNIHLNFEANSLHLDQGFHHYSASMLVKMLWECGFPAGLQITLSATGESSLKERKLAEELELATAYHDPYDRLVSYIKNPEPDARIYVSEEMRKRYDAEFGSLASNMTELIKSQKLAPRSMISFSPLALHDKREAEAMFQAATGTKIPAYFDLNIPSRAGNGDDISIVQGKLYDYVQRKKSEADDIAFAMMMSTKLLELPIKNDGVLHDYPVKEATQLIYENLTSSQGSSRQKSADLQIDKVRDRRNAYQRWSLFKAAAVAAGSFALAVGLSSLAKK